MTKNTNQVATELNVPEAKLRYLIRTGKARPSKGENGRYSWDRKSVSEARKAVRSGRK